MSVAVPPAPVETDQIDQTDSGALRLSEDGATALAAVITGQAAAQAQLDHALLLKVAEFDAGEGSRWFADIRDTTHWLSWACSMAPLTAREHVRVARALRRMPQTSRLMAEGRLSYSKVREMSRVVGVVDESRLCELALAMTAAQLARTVRAFRADPGTRLAHEAARRFTWREDADGMVRMSVALPAEEAAVLRGAIDRAVDDQLAGGESPDRALAVVEVARRAMEETSRSDAEPSRSGEERAIGTDGTGMLDSGERDSGERASEAGTAHGPCPSPVRTEALVVVHVDAAVLESADAGADVPAGTAYAEAGGRIEGATASRLLCNGSVVGARVDSTGAVLSFGRRRRLVSTAQRMALTVRAKGMCQYPGCTVTHRLDAHHVVPWSLGGPTDLDNLVLLCRFHHTCVHEGGVTVEDDEEAPGGRRFRRPDGTPVLAPGDRGWWAVDRERQLFGLLGALDRASQDDDRISPVGGGAGFSLAECVDALHAARTPRSEEPLG